MLQKETREHKDVNAKGNTMKDFRHSHKAMQAQHTKQKLPYVICDPRGSLISFQKFPTPLMYRQFLKLAR